MASDWENVQDGCMLCEMDKRTEWYEETENWVVAENLGGGDFVVSKTHQEEISDEEWEEMEEVVGRVFDEFDITVLMNIIRDHWHGHITNSQTINVTPDE